MSDSTLFPFLPAWPPTFNQLGWFALIVLGAILLGEVADRYWRLPRILGWIVAGMVIGPYPIGLLSIETLREMRPALDVALGLVLFQLGHRLDMSWLRRNPWLLVASLLEAGLTAAAIFGVLRLSGMGAIHAAAAAAIGMSTSPAVIVQLTRELRAQGQVTERLHLLAALNSAYAVIAVTMWLAWLHLEYKDSPLTVVFHPLYLMLGSLALAALGALAAHLVPRGLRRHEDVQLLLILGSMLLLIAVADMIQASLFLTVLAFGFLTKHRVEWLRVLPKHLSILTSIAVVILFALVGAGIDPAAVVVALPVGLAFVAARALAKSLAVWITARPSGLAPRKGLLLGLGLSPMSGLAIVLVQDTSGVYPDFPSDLFVVILTAVTLLAPVGPLLTRLALVRARETRAD